jgi:hypothetical protein
MKKLRGLIINTQIKLIISVIIPTILTVNWSESI